MIVLFTDFGDQGPYVGQMRNVLEREAPGFPVIELFSNAPRFDPLASAYLLAAYVDEFPSGTVFLCVVDPGVGSDQRKPVAFTIDGRWFVGPDNGLFDVVVMRGKEVQCWEITWQPEKLSNSFHGRDLFAPVAARLARGESPPGVRLERSTQIIHPEDWPHIIYIDHFGNAMTGIRAQMLLSSMQIMVGNRLLNNANTFAEVSVGKAFWYENANGLVEIAVNQGNAADELALGLGDEVKIVG